MADSKTRALSRVPLFSQLSRSELEFVASRSDEVSVKAGHKLITQGSPGDSFYVLLEGEAHVDVKGKPRRTMRPGDFFGEISMLDRGLASATVTAKTDARLLVMSHAQFRDAIKASDGLLVKVLAAMGERLRADMMANEKLPPLPAGERVEKRSPSPRRGEGRGEGRERT
jgi:CRP-like cAMP-binding protein